MGPKSNHPLRVGSMCISMCMCMFMCMCMRYVELNATVLRRRVPALLCNPETHSAKSRSQGEGDANECARLANAGKGGMLVQDRREGGEEGEPD